MKIFSYAIMLTLLALAAGALAVGCQEHGQSAAPAPAAVPAAKAGAYTCPMHADVKADKPGKCPKCGMDLVPVKESK